MLLQIQELNLIKVSALIFGRRTEKRLLAANSDQSYWSKVYRQFKKNRIAIWASRILLVLLFIALFGDFIANEKPIYCKINGKSYFPIMKQYAVDLGLDHWDAEILQTKWIDKEYDYRILAPIPYSSSTKDYKNARFVSPFAAQKLKSPRYHHILGTDGLGRDVAAGMIAGTRTAMLVGLIAMSIATLIGLFFGVLAGYFGDERLNISRGRLLLTLLGLFLGWFYGFSSRAYAFHEGAFISATLVGIGIVLLFIIVAQLLTLLLKRIPFFKTSIRIPLDVIVMRLIEIFRSIPGLLLILAIIAAIEQKSIFIVMVIIGLISWTGIARFTRAELLRVRNLEFIEAAQSMGFPEWRIILRHALPNALTPVLITIAFGIASAILLEAFISYLGIGIDDITWGSMLNSSRSDTKAWWMAIFPGLAIFITVTIFNLIGEGLTDALDPKSKVNE